MELIAEEKTDTVLFETKPDIVESASTSAPAGSLSCSYKRASVRQLKHENQWNKYGTQHKNPKKIPAVSRPSKEEILKRRQWEAERRLFHEVQAKVKASKKAEAEVKKKEKENAQAEVRKAAILERSRRWQERHMQLTQERERGKDQYKQLRETHKKLLHEKLYEEYAKNSQMMEMAKRKVYSERLGRFRSLRPKEIIEGDALKKFKTEVGDISEANRRSKSTPCQRRNTKSVKNTRSCSNARPRVVGSSRPDNSVNSTTSHSPKAKKASLQENNVAKVPSQVSPQKEVSHEHPVEEVELQGTLEKQRQEEERLEAAPEVVEEDNNHQVAEQSNDLTEETP